MAHLHYFVAAFAVVLMATASSAMYSKKSGVITLDQNNFDKEVLASDDFFLVEFFAPWCGHCKALAPEYRKAAKALNGIAKIGAVDCDKEQALAQKYGVKGFPTLKVFAQDKKNPTDYQGARTAQGIVDGMLETYRQVANRRLGGKGGGSARPSSGGGQQGGGEDSFGYASSASVVLTEDNFEQTVMQSKGAWLVEFYAPWCSHCKALAPVWSELAAVLRGQVRVGALDTSANPVVAETFRVVAYPTLVFLVRGRVYHYESEGTRTLPKLKSFALGGYHNADWSELPSDMPDGEVLGNSESPSLWMVVQYASYQVVFGTFYFWKRAKVPSTVTFLLGVLVGGVLTIVVTKAATNRHLAELEDELLDQIDALERERDAVLGHGKKGKQE